jgi:hypothetical protein
VRAKLKRTDPVRKAGGRNRQGSRGSGGKKDEKSGRKKDGDKTYSRRDPCYGEVRRRGGERSKETGPDCSRSLSSWGPYSGGET